MSLSAEVKTDIIIGAISISISLVGLWLIRWSTKRLGGRVDEGDRQQILVNMHRSPLDTPLVIVIDGLHFADTGGSRLLAPAENSNWEPEGDSNTGERC